MNIIREIQKRLFPKKLKCVYRKDILEYALKYNHKSGVCNSIWCSLLHYGLDTNINRYLRLSNLHNAKRFGAESTDNGYWWPINDWTNRIKYLK